MPKVIIADDEEFVRDFLKVVIDPLSFEVVAEVDKGDELFSAMMEHNPDILFIDLHMPNLTGIEFLRKYVSKFPDTCIFILTSATSASILEEDFLDGVQCFLKKDMPIDTMIDTIQQVWGKFERAKNA